MRHEGFTPPHRNLGRAAAGAVFGLGVAYAATMALGFRSLKSPQDPFGEPYFTLMELLILLMVPLMLVSLAAVHAYAPGPTKIYSLMALCCLAITTGLTSGVHFVVLTVSRPLQAAGLAGAPLLFDFNWPSVVYSLDILAWDWFFALAMLFAAPVFNTGRLEKILRILLITSGVISLVGLLGVPLANMQVRNIGIIGYAVVGPVVFLLLGILFNRTPTALAGAAPRQ